MYTLTRHILIELIKIFVIAVVALTAMFLVVVVVQQAMKEGLPLSGIPRLIPYVLPDMLRFTVPATLLLATTTVLARMSGANEIVAIKALGISPLTVITPVLVMAFFLSLVTVWLNDLAVSWGRVGAQRVVIEAAEEIAYNTLRAQRYLSAPGFSIGVKRVEGRRLVHVTISMEANASSAAAHITADEAELRADPVKNVLKIIARNGKFEIPGTVDFQFPHDEIEQEIPLRNATKTDGDASTPSWMPLRDIPIEIAKTEQMMCSYDQEIAATSAFAMLSGEFDTLVNPDAWRSEEGVRDTLQTKRHRLLTEPHRRWSSGFSCLFFVWIGAPMAIRLRRGDFLTSFFMCFMPILIVYYPAMIYGVGGSKHGTIPPWSVWGCNAILLLWGGYLLRKVIRY
jgi:lipopolysaccharide export system permease protein